MKTDQNPSLDAVAAVVHRLAVLLSAGVAPASAWTYLAASLDGAVGEHAALIAAQTQNLSVLEAILDSLPQAEVVSGSRRRARVHSYELAWRGLAAAWLVATEAGASLAPSLRSFAESLSELAQAQREVSVALAGPAATAKLVLTLPFVGILFGMALGFDTLGTLFTTFPGVACLVAGSALLLIGRWWNHHLLRSAAPTKVTPGLELGLLAIAVSGGSSIERARATVAAAANRCALAESDGEEVITEVLQLSRRAGVPAATLLRSEAEHARRLAKSEAQEQAARLGITLMFPLGLCVLPAFMLLGVAPLVIAIISSTVGSF